MSDLCILDLGCNLTLRYPVHYSGVAVVGACVVHAGVVGDGARRQKKGSSRPVGPAIRPGLCRRRSESPRDTTSVGMNLCGKAGRGGLRAASLLSTVSGKMKGKLRRSCINRAAGRIILSSRASHLNHSNEPISAPIENINIPYRRNSSERFQQGRASNKTAAPGVVFQNTAESNRIIR